MTNMAAKVLLDKMLQREDLVKGSLFLKIFLILFLVEEQNILGKKIILKTELKLKRVVMF